VPSAPATQPSPVFLGHLLGFVQRLRAAGLPADPGSAVTLAEALRHIDPARPRDFHAACRALLVHRQEHLATFDEVYRSYWRQQFRPGRPRPEDDRTELTGGRPSPAPRPPDSVNADDAPPDATASYSPDELIARRDLATLSEADIERARELIRDFIIDFASLRTRRHVRHHRGRLPDFRRMLRRLAAHGGELPELFYRRRLRRTRLLLLCDVSGSMARYSRFLLEFIYALRRELPETEVAVFATRLTVITDLLAARSVAQSLREVAARAGDWGGGTDIGGCLREFNDRYGPQMVRSTSVVVLLSDGWDCGNATLMGVEMARLRQRAGRLIWLNPLLGSPDYEPLTRGMRTALPHLDDFLPAHSLQSLQKVARALATSV
ncbi:MAG: VWA domain-containing protein, partial [Gammaproteobacteria bacterium]|nr:VWA domain-containing protein [Gammaproteobacteria bacterium]